MAGTRQILQRRLAAQNISKVTHTMETISSVRYRQYYRMWLEGLEYFNAMAQLSYIIASAHPPILHPLLHTNPSSCHAILVTGSNRGLCGSYNSNVCRMLDVHLKMAARFKRPLKIYVHGKRIVSFLNQRGIKPERVLDQFDEVPKPEQVAEIADEMTQDFLKGNIGRLGFVYTRFFSPASQQAQTLTILPMLDLIDDLTTRATVIWPWEMVFDDFLLSPSADDIFDGLSSLMIRTAVAGCFIEAATSEHLSRVTAMRNATDNADEMIEDLTREYNRARQSQITNEMLDIIGGVQASARK
jgi:F-type H+-transporting ATPase subunit gamma